MSRSHVASFLRVRFRVPSFGFRVSSFGFRVSSFEFRFSGLGCRVLELLVALNRQLSANNTGFEDVQESGSGPCGFQRVGCEATP